MRWRFGLLLFSKKRTDRHVVDLTLVGLIKHADGIGKISYGIAELLCDDLKVKCFPTNFFAVKNLNPKMNEVIFSRGRWSGGASSVSILTEQVFTQRSRPYWFFPASKVKIAYSMIESTLIPMKWGHLLNRYFDAVVVPDQSLVEIYQNSGVKIPIFELPIGLDLSPFFAAQKQEMTKDPFVFGTTVSCDPRKNIPLLIQAFSEEFGNHPNVVLRINSRSGDDRKCRALIDALGLKNVVFAKEVLQSRQYIDLMRTFDCFINISMGEGFSICPREALALGVPCILSNQSAHKTICMTNFVRSVPCPIELPAFESMYGKEQLGHFHTCSVEEVRLALRDVYNNYAIYLDKAVQGRAWVAKYQWGNLKNQYLNLVKPKKIVLGNKNRIFDDGLETVSFDLYEKYKTL